MILGKRPQGPEHLRANSDDDLCRKVSNGNHEAFLVLFDRYCRDVFRLAYSVLRNKEEAEDLVQSLFLEVHTTMLRYDGQRGSFRTLLLRYAYTRAIDHRRHLESRRFYTNVQLEALRPEVLAQDGAIASGLSQEEGARLVEQAMGQLEGKQEAVVRAYFFRGLSLNEIADELGESFGNTRHHLYRGLEKMRKALALSEGAKEFAERERIVTLKLRTRLSRQVRGEASVGRARSI